MATSSPNDRPATSQPSADSTWSNHEHVSGAAHLQAQRLLDEVGSPELAKQAVDQAASAAEPDQDVQTTFAQELGFVSYLDLFEATNNVLTASGKARCVTVDRNGRWAVWDPEHLKVLAWCDSLEFGIEFAKLSD